MNKLPVNRVVHRQQTETKTMLITFNHAHLKFITVNIPVEHALSCKIVISTVPPTVSMQSTLL